MSRRSTRNRALTLGAAILTALALVPVACVPTPTVPPTTSVPPSGAARALDRAVDWILDQFNSQGYMPVAGDPTSPDLGAGVIAVATLASLGKGAETARQRLDELESNFETYVDEGAGDRPGALARVILAVVAAGGDPRDFGGNDLVSRLEATQQPDGLFGLQYAGFDGAFRQGLALSALSLVNPPPTTITPGPGQTINDVPAVAWLLNQQCGDGSWLMFRASTAGRCIEVPSMQIYKDSNGSALAALGLAAVDATPRNDPAAWFTSVRGLDGGWGASPSGPTQVSDSNSTGLVIAALEALDEAPDSTAYDTLLSFQIERPDPDEGAFMWRPSSRGVIRMSTLDAVVALYDRVWPAALLP
ncbi:MAG: hypothetical protein WBA45_10525 [Microthrixaceae bacterium]